MYHGTNSGDFRRLLLLWTRWMYWRNIVEPFVENDTFCLVYDHHSLQLFGLLLDLHCQKIKNGREQLWSRKSQLLRYQHLAGCSRHHLHSLYDSILANCENVCLFLLQFHFERKCQNESNLHQRKRSYEIKTFHLNLITNDK